MQMNNVFSTQNSFSGTIMSQLHNSCDIQRASEKEKYNNDEILYFEDTEMGIILYDNILMNKYYEKIKRTANVLNMTKEMNIKYKFRPEALSTDQYGFPGLWYLILYLNNCEDVSEFHDLPFVLMPNMTIIQECLNNEEYIQTKDEL